MFHVPELFRVAGVASDCNNGHFRIGKIMIRASDGAGWEHVSVSLIHRVPSWEEMCRVKAIFWDDEDVVIQYHPARSNYVNHNPYVLHLWRPIDDVIPMPPVFCV